MDNLQLRQRIVRSMIRVSERTANMRKPEKFEYRKHMTAAFMDMLELCIEANRARGSRRVELQNKMDTKLDVLRSLVDTAVSPEDRLISPGYRKPTAQSVKKMKARMRYIAKEYEAGLIDFDAVDATMQSYFGLMGHCSTHGLQKWIEKNIIFKRKEMADIELPQEVTQWELNQF